MKAFVVLSCSLSFLNIAFAASCGSQAKGALCPDSQCCSQWGNCGTTADFCLTSLRCQSQCINDGPPPKQPGDIPDIDESKLFVPPDGTFNNKKLIGYFSNWAQYRGYDPSTPGCTNGTYSFLPENINPHLYTHINYAAFVFMAENYSIVAHEHNDEELGLRMNKWVHRINPGCTTSLSVGGWSMNDGPSKYTGGVDYTPFFSQMASSASTRATFIDSSIEWARRLEFDGIDIDWEFIGDPTRGGTSDDRENFNSLVREMREAFQAEAASSGKTELMITMAAPAGPDDFANIDAKTISDYVDWINLMTYDFYGNWNDTVENHAPIADTFIPGWSFTSAIDQYVGAGVPPAKLMAGLPLYGRVWTLSDLSQTSPGSPGTAGTAGRCTAEHGYLAYFEIKDIMDVQEGGGVSFEPLDGYYLVFDDQWVGYDDEVTRSPRRWRS
ncbi:hypothetical protein BDZ89DRAFT_539128 [Hymenopellis radicata]|nr:hypothetical protein BDZ89DRAFT_539128 [Hymenopellis radicata]